MEISKEVSIKDLLKGGTTEEELHNILKEQINEAKAELKTENENKKATRLVDKRAAAAEAIQDYLNTLGRGKYVYADDITKLLTWLEKHETVLKDFIDAACFYNCTKCNKENPALKSNTLDYVDKILETYKNLFE